MKSHVFRPILVAIGALILFLVVRYQLVPSDFGVHGKNFTYGYYRLGSIDDWKAFEVTYQDKKSCDGDKCHESTVKDNLDSQHKLIECENCHGPNLPHLDDPKKYDYLVDRTRTLCLRCHSYLPYPGNFRSTKRGIDPQNHYIDYECAQCHNPHKSHLFTDLIRIPHRPKLKEIK